MWTQFFLQNAHFAVSFFTAFVFFSVAWLYFDAWSLKKNWSKFIRASGFLVLSISFLIHAAFIETGIFESSLIGGELYQAILIWTKIAGYLLIIISLIIEPLNPHPQMAGLEKESFANVGNPLLKFGLLAIPPIALKFVNFSFLHPILATTCGLLYLRRATRGFEDHLKKVAISFYILSLSEVLSLASLLRNSDDIDLYNIVSPFGPVWMVEHITLFLAALILGIWVWGYLLKRIDTQLFMIFSVFILVIFLATTVSFTGLLLKNLQEAAILQLETDVKVLSFAIEGKRSEALGSASLFAKNEDLASAIESKSRKELADLAESYLLDKKQNFLVVVNSDGQVLARGEDRERVGDSLSDDSLVQRVLAGKTSSSIYMKDAVLASEISIRAAAPVLKDKEVIGAVLTGEILDSAFLDGVKSATGLEASLYAGDQLSATTIIGPDTKSRLSGIKEVDKKILEKVLGRGEAFSGSSRIGSSSYFGAYLSLTDVDENPVGMMFVGKPQVEVLKTAGRSIELTFIVALAMITLSILPAYLISRHLAEQLK